MLDVVHDGMPGVVAAGDVPRQAVQHVHLLAFARELIRTRGRGGDVLTGDEEVLDPPSRVPPSDGLICRHGGEEIVVALPAGGNDGAHQLARAVAEQIAEEHDGIPGVTVSYGIVEPRVVGAQEAADVLRLADQAMYAAKAGGRARGAWWPSAEHLQISSCRDDAVRPVAA